MMNIWKLPVMGNSYQYELINVLSKYLMHNTCKIGWKSNHQVYHIVIKCIFSIKVHGIGHWDFN